jgi:hypothetical protein
MIAVRCAVPSPAATRLGQPLAVATGVGLPEGSGMALGAAPLAAEAEPAADSEHGGDGVLGAGLPVAETDGAGDGLALATAGSDGGAVAW